jgi:maltooligosyltrehalose trehalohydrolase
VQHHTVCIQPLETRPLPRSALLAEVRRPGGAPAPLGASPLPDAQVAFHVWAPRCRSLEVEIVPAAGPPVRVPATRDAEGYHEAVVRGGAGLRYRYVLDGERVRPDPAARALPEGVHGVAEVVDMGAFVWSDAGWRGRPLDEYVLYELHVGTFTPEGTFDGVIARLPDLRALGVTAIELMPVASFPGDRNWGYDGVGLYAPQQSYGGPEGLARLVDACHEQGLCVVLDVVYNHLGPEGNYLAEFGPYFTDRHRTPWGDAVNFDGPDAGPVRRFFVENAVRWVTEFHVDGLRLDAIHGIVDDSAVHILRELNDAVQRAARRAGRAVHVIAESDLNERRVIERASRGGYGLAAQWSDDFHHALHALLTGERSGYYADFGRVEQLAKAYTDGFVYTGERSVHRGRPHGTPSRDLPGERFVVFAQNHDQVGNRARGERLTALVPFEALKAAAAAYLLAPALPLLFMGEEYGEPAPFLYFTSHGDPALASAVSVGRREEFKAFGWQGEVPDPQDPDTFERSILDWTLAAEEPHASLRACYRALLELRREEPALGPRGKDRVAARAIGDRAIAVIRRAARGQAFVLVNLGEAPVDVRLAPGSGRYVLAIDTADPRFAGPGGAAPADVSGTLEARLPGFAAWVYRRQPGGRRRRGD